MCKGKITLLRNLKEGDKFHFCDQSGKIKSSEAYYVEGQYPKFHCTTVFAERNITHYFNGAPSSVDCECVTGVENSQYVKIDECAVLHVKHNVVFGEEDEF